MTGRPRPSVTLRPMLTSSIQARPWRTPRLPDLVGAREARELLGFAPVKLNRWVEHRWLPEPARVAAGPVWARADIEAIAADLEAQKREGAPRPKPRIKPWRTLRLPDLAGAAEARAILGIDKSMLSRWMEPRSGSFGPDLTYMVVPVQLSASPIWARADIERFRDENRMQEWRASRSGRHRPLAHGRRPHKPLAVVHLAHVTPRLADLVGVSDVAALLDSDVDQVYRWLEPGTGMHGAELTFLPTPSPTSDGPVWARRDIERFAEQQKRIASAD